MNRHNPEPHTLVGSAGMLPPPRNGMTSPVIASGLGAGDRVGLTIEPDGGTSHPTGAPILLMPL